MKIAVTYQNGQIFQHFGQSKQFKVYNIENGKLTDSNVLDTNGAGHGALAGFIKTTGAEAIICGGIGGGAISALSDSGIKVYAGVSGNADEAVNLFINGNLKYSSEANCSHHEHEHGHGHGQCGNHGCGNHS